MTGTDTVDEARQGSLPGIVRLTDQFGFTVGQEVTVTRRLWEPADECHPGGMLAQPGDRLIVRAIRDRGEWPISVSHHDRTDGMTFSVAENELRAYTAAFVKPNVGGELTAPAGTASDNNRQC